MMRHPLRTFFVLAFALAWGVPGLVLLWAAQTGTVSPDLGEFSLLSYVSLWAPATAAFLVILWGHGPRGVARYLRRAVRPTGAWRWYAAVGVGIPLLNLAAAAGMEGIGREAMTGAWPLGAALLVLALLRLTEGPMEEVGWRGFALPLLQRRFSGWTASVVLGGLWALWHLPAFFVGRAVGGGISGGLLYAFGMFTLTLIAQSVLLTVLFNVTRGSVLIAVLFHWMTNLPYPWEAGLDLSPVAGPLWIAVALGVGLTVGRRYLGRVHQSRDVAPGVFPPMNAVGPRSA